MLLKCYTQYASKFGKLSCGHRTGKGHFNFNPKKDDAKECSNYYTIVLIHMVERLCSKSFNLGSSTV